MSKGCTPSIQVRPILLQVLHHISSISVASGNRVFQSECSTILITCLLLICPVEYICFKSDSTPFRLKYISFLCVYHVFSETAIEADLQAATFVTLTFISQNNVVEAKISATKPLGAHSYVPSLNSSCAHSILIRTS